MSSSNEYTTIVHGHRFTAMDGTGDEADWMKCIDCGLTTRFPTQSISCQAVRARIDEPPQAAVKASVPDYGVLKPFEHDIERFVDAMKYKMRLNAHKGRWEDLNLDAALTKLRGEVEELQGAIKIGNTVEILLEAADIANFAMIVASIAIERAKK